MIVGITHNRDGRVVQRLSVSTKIAIGLPPSGERNYPTKLDHFVFLRKKRTARGVEWELDPVLIEHYGKEAPGERLPCAEYPLDPLTNLQAQYIGLSHIHLRQQLGARIWYAGSIARCDYSETEAKGYNLITLKERDPKTDLSDLDVTFRESPTAAMMILEARYDNGELQFAVQPDARQVKNARVKVVVTIPSELHNSLGREEQERFRAQLLAASPSELKIKIEHDTETTVDSAPLSQAKTAADKLIAYWALKGEPGAERRDELLHKLAEIETVAISG